MTNVVKVVAIENRPNSVLISPKLKNRSIIMAILRRYIEVPKIFRGSFIFVRLPVVRKSFKFYEWLHQKKNIIVFITSVSTLFDVIEYSIADGRNTDTVVILHGLIICQINIECLLMLSNYKLNHLYKKFIR